MGSPGADEQARGPRRLSSLLQPSWRWHLVPLRKRPSLDPTQRLRLIPGMDTTATATDHTDMATTAMATDMATTTERGLLMPSQLLRLLPTLRLRLIPGMDTTGILLLLGFHPIFLFLRFLGLCFINWSRSNKWDLILILCWHVHLESLSH